MANFKIMGSRKLDKEQQSTVIELMKNYYQNVLEIEKANNAARMSGEKLSKVPSKTKFINELKEKNLNYSKDNMYHDLRRYASYYKAKSPEKAERAQIWFDNYFEPFRKKNKLTVKQAMELWQRAKTQSYEYMSISELELAIELREGGSG